MLVLQIAILLVITCLPAWMVLSRLVPRNAPGRYSLLGGYSILLGLVTVTLAMRFLSYLGIPFSMLAVAACMLPLLLVWWLLPRPVDTALRSDEAGGLSAGGKFLVAVCMALIVARIGMIAIEVLNHPVFPWDSKLQWAKQARVFLEYRSLVPYVTELQWLYRAEPQLYTVLHPDYPVTIPLMQAWIGVALGGWHDIYVNLPWLLCYFAFGLVFYGQARAAGVDVAVTLVSTYMLLSLPLLNTHVALAGYADPFMGLAVLGAFAAFLQWSLTRAPWQGLLAAFCALSCILFKQEGLFWALAFLPALLVVRLGVARGYVLIVAGVVLVPLLLWLLPPKMAIAGHSIREMYFAYRPTAWYPLFEGLFLQDNWHLTAYLFLITLLAALIRDRRVLAMHAPSLTVIVVICTLYMVLYLFTGYSTDAAEHTSINRLALHFIPALWFVTLILFNQLRQSAHLRAEHALAD